MYKIRATSAQNKWTDLWLQYLRHFLAVFVCVPNMLSPEGGLLVLCHVFLSPANMLVQTSASTSTSDPGSSCWGAE